jgi:hypothetical protein
MRAFGCCAVEVREVDFYARRQFRRLPKLQAAHQASFCQGAAAARRGEVTEHLIEVLSRGRRRQTR